MRHQILLALITFTCFSLLGCNSTESQPAAAQPAAAAEADRKSWELADHSEKFTGWVSGDNHAGKRSWIWCDVQRGPVSYRVIGGVQSGGWKPMDKIQVSEDESQTITVDPNGQFGAAELLPSGKYTVEFKVGMEEFSAVTLRVD
jgi:hypothetical protein